jgi:trehalose 6-phosphate phosphatase
MTFRRPAGDQTRTFIEAARNDRSRTLIALDVDGTVSEIAPSPDRAFVDDEMRSLLRALAQDYQLWFVSGRDANETARMVDVASAGYIGDHGREILAGPDARPLTAEPPHSGALALVAREVVADVPEVAPFVERKHWGVAFHYRAIASPHTPRRLRESIQAHLAPGLTVLPGKMVLEVTAAGGSDKGSALRWLIDSIEAERVLAAGDDQTDVAMFRALARRRARLRVVVRQGLETPKALVAAADVAVNGVGGLRALLQEFL